MQKADFWEKDGQGKVRCLLCPHRCQLREGAGGICGVRVNCGGVLFASGYGEVSSIALDPIEKKPLYMFHPGKQILSVGGFGCNLRCPFCQNHEISMVYTHDHGTAPEYGGSDGDASDGGGGSDSNSDGGGDSNSGGSSDGNSGGSSDGGDASDGGGGGSDGGGGSGSATPPARRALPRCQVCAPEDIAALAIRTIPDGNIGVAYTYNEPLIGYEFVRDCARLVHDAGLANVLVTNGFINKEPLSGLLPLIDAMNIDLKGFTKTFYKKLGGGLDAVQETIKLARQRCHVEVTTLVIPGENEDDIGELARWLSLLDPDIPLHLSRFFPRYRYSGASPTPRASILRLREIAAQYLNNVFTGNMG